MLQKLLIFLTVWCFGGEKSGKSCGAVLEKQARLVATLFESHDKNRLNFHVYNNHLELARDFPVVFP